MAFRLELRPSAVAFADSLSPSERGGLSHCWDLLRANPYADGVTKITTALPPLPISHTVRTIHFCGAYKSIYHVRGDLITVYAAAWRLPQNPHP